MGSRLRLAESAYIGEAADSSLRKGLHFDSFAGSGRQDCPSQNPQTSKIFVMKGSFLSGATGCPAVTEAQAQLRARASD